VQVVGNGGAFAALKSDGSVITWGAHDEGGDITFSELWDISSVHHLLQESVVQIVGSAGAFAAIKIDGSVVTWGSPASGGNSYRVQDQLQEGVIGVVSEGKVMFVMPWTV